MTAKIQLRRDTLANWASNTLAAGEVGLEIDSNVVVGVKIGGNSTPQAYDTIEYLQGTLPARSTSGIASFNDAALRAFGRFTFSNPVGVTDGPITFAPTDGAAHMLVTTHGTSAIQNLFIEGDGTVPSKFYQRIYDGDDAAWRSWNATSNWAVDASDGTPITCTTLDAKGVATFADGTAAAPSISNDGDTDTGISFPSDNTVVISTNGTAAITVGSSQGVALSANLEVGGSLDMTSGTISNLASPTLNDDAATKAYVDGIRLGQSATLAVTGATINSQTSGNATSGVFQQTGSTITTLRSVAAGSEYRGVGILSDQTPVTITINTSSCSVSALFGIPLPSPNTSGIFVMNRVL